MAEALTASVPAPKRGRKLRVLGWICGVGFLLVMAAYFAATSSFFLKGFILPQVGKAINATVTIDSASISPFSSVILHNLKVQANGAEPLLTAGEVRARYSLFAILGGHIKVDEVALVSPTISLIEQPDGSKNIDAILKSQTKSTPAKAEPVKSSGKPPQFDIARVIVSDATFRSVKKYRDGQQDVAEVGHLNLEISNVKNGQAGKLVLTADVNADNNPPAPTPKGLMQGRLTGDFAFALTDNAAPQSFKGGIKFEVSKADGNLGDFTKLVVGLDAEATTAEIKQIALHFNRAEASLGEVRLSGPFDLQKTEGNLRMEIRSIDKEVLNLLGAKNGMDFGSTMINSTNQISVSSLGAKLSVVGGIHVVKFQIARGSAATPVVDMHTTYGLDVDTGAGNVRLNNFTMAARQNGMPLLLADLSVPLVLAWGSEVRGVGDSGLELVLTNLSLSDWKALAGDNVPSGKVNAQVMLSAQSEGRLLFLKAGSQVDDLTLNTGSNHAAQVAVALNVQASATKLADLKLDDCRLEVTGGGQSLVSASASGTYQSASANADLQFHLQAMLGRLLEVLALPETSVASGAVELQGRVAQNAKSQTVTGTFKLADLTGHVGQNKFQGFNIDADWDLARESQLVEIRKLAGSLLADGKPGGRFNVSGKYDVSANAGEITAALDGFNQDGLRPFIEPMLPGKKLSSLAINGSATVKSGSQGDMELKAGLQIANLVVTDVGGQSVGKPLEARIQVDTSVSKQVAEVRQFQVTLTPTDRAKNELTLSGRVDTSKTNATTGNLKLAADSLDLTPYYDLFAGDTNAPAAPPKASAPAPATEAEEPAAMELPVRDFVVNAAIGHLYLREIDVANFQTTVKIDGGHVLVDPFKLDVNSAPVTAKVDLDLGVPGYKYDVSFSADKIPQAPIVNSLQPDRKGQISGTLTADAAVKGAGTTGVNLKKNLAGDFNVVSTNLDLAIPNVRSPILFGIINTIIALPELINGSFGGKKGWLDDFMSKPIDLVEVHGTMGSGAVELKKTGVRGINFQAGAAGKIVFADILTNSTLKIPIDVYLGYHSAEGLGLTTSGQTPANTPYVKLPQFLTMKGTIGAPGEDINKLALAKLAGETLGGIGKNLGKVVGTNGNSLSGTVGKKASSIFNALKSLTGPKTNSTAASP